MVSVQFKAERTSIITRNSFTEGQKTSDPSDNKFKADSFCAPSSSIVLMELVPAMIPLMELTSPFKSKLNSFD